MTESGTSVMLVTSSGISKSSRMRLKVAMRANLTKPCNGAELFRIPAANVLLISEVLNWADP